MFFAQKSCVEFVHSNKISFDRDYLIDNLTKTRYNIIANKIYEKDKAKLTVLHDLFKAKTACGILKSLYL